MEKSLKIKNWIKGKSLLTFFMVKTESKNNDMTTLVNSLLSMVQRILDRYIQQLLGKFFRLSASVTFIFFMNKCITNQRNSIESLPIKLPTTTYGYTINSLLTDDSMKVIIIPPIGFILVITVQMIILGYLCCSLPEPHITSWLIPLQFAVIWVFLLELISSFYHIRNEALIISHFSKTYYIDSDYSILNFIFSLFSFKSFQKIEIKNPISPIRRIFAYLIVLVEFLVLCGVFYVGIMHILSSNNVNEIAQSCYSFIFIKDLGNTVLYLDISKKKNLDVQHFEVIPVKHSSLSLLNCLVGIKWLLLPLH
mmetsp:Transcript_25663/g.35299  ORF Transcript_25663/g.35299 Transcript_25663/m.35299 type:complete len:309 (+) Transcript_25663:45-971(+)